jgi:nicotinate-nucleotide adenylyltransferase
MSNTAASPCPVRPAGHRRLGILGGTFDPIHYGHLDAAAAAQTALALDWILIVPSHDPPHRPANPHATAFHRFALAALAIDGLDGYRVSDMELRRSGPSYTIATLGELREAGWAPSQLFFILGTDAFADIATWHRYPEVLDAANFAIVTRPGAALDAAIDRVPEARGRLGRTVCPVPADSRNVSSTAIRARLAARQSIDDLVPASIARYILAHNLYGAVNDLHGQEQHI